MDNLRDVLEKRDGTGNMIERCLEVVKKSQGVVIFGAGVGGAKIYNILKDYNYAEKIKAWSDNNELKFGHQYMEERLKIVSPKELIVQYSDCDIIVASSAYDIIKQQLVSEGFSEDKISLFNFAFMETEYTDCKFIWDNICNFERAYEKMEDEKSKRIFVNILNYKITKDEEYLLDMQKDVDDEYYQYFPDDLFEFISTECLLDVGAYTGDTLEKYDNIYRHNWKKYYGFEADKLVFSHLEEYIHSKYPNDKTEVFCLAAWDKDTVLYFEENAGSSKMDDSKGTNAVVAKRIDDVLLNKEVTFIKMDIEGAEKYALEGCKGIIKQYKPILAICVYHLRDDFFALTDLMEAILPGEYMFYMRQYRYTPTETVVYAVPKNRII